MTKILRGHHTAGRSLTPREIQVLERTAVGRTNAAVAADLGITVHAVKFHLSSIFRKLGVQNRTEAAVKFLAVEGGIENGGPVA